MRTFNYEGHGSDGSQMVQGGHYLARYLGDPDNKMGDSKEPDKEPKMYRACKSGRLFVMRDINRNKRGYHLPMAMEFAGGG